MTLALRSNPILRRPVSDRPAQVSGSSTFTRAASKRELLHLLHVCNAAEHLARLPDDDESIHANMKGNFHAWDLVSATFRLAAPATIDAMTVATLGFNQQNENELFAMLDDGRIR